jgi:formiminoglutamase
MDVTQFGTDPLWPRAGERLVHADAETPTGCDIALLGVPACKRSLSPTGADATPAAVRAALMRYSTWSGSHGVDVAELHALDFGDADDPDGYGGEARVAAAAAHAGASGLLLAIGGDNSVTYPLMLGVSGGDLAGWGLITIDAHHDLRDGESNGSPVRRLVAAGLPGSSIVQVGIADFSNSAAYAARARDLGITVIHRAEVRDDTIEAVAAAALKIAGAGGRPIYVDVDVDVCDRGEVPGCPAAAPGGISADQLRRLVFLLGRDVRVRTIDFTEIDATADTPDERTVRLAALLLLEASAGFASR